MSSLNDSVGAAALKQLAYERFDSMLALGIHCLHYFFLIKSTSRFDYITNDFEITARISEYEYLEESYIHIMCPRTQFDFDILWFRGYKEGNEVKVEEILPHRSSYFTTEVINGIKYLTIFKAYPSLAGSYTCMNRVGDKYMDYTTRIYLKELPKFRYFDRRVFGSKNKSITIRCSVLSTDDSNTDINWERNNEVLLPSDKYRMSRFHDDFFLKIANLTETDAGWYYCVLSKYPMRKKKIVLYIKSLPEEISEDTEIKTENEGQRAIFRCPTREFKFTQLIRIVEPYQSEIIISQKLSYDNSNTDFQLTSVYPGHDGIYFCRTSHDPPSKCFLLLVIEKLPTLFTQSKMISAFQGTNVKMRCESSFRSFQEIIWTIEETGSLIAYGNDLKHQYLNQMKLFTDQNSSTLSIMSVDFKHASTYICRLGRQKAKLNLTINAIPQIQGCGYNKMLHLGDDARFICKHHSAPGLNLTWFQDDVKLPPNSSKYTMENGELTSVLIVHSLDSSDNGNYIPCFDILNNNCADYESYGLYFILPIHVHVMEKRNKLSYDNRHELLTDGDSYKMNCSIHRLFHGEKLCWEFPDGSVHQCSQEHTTIENHVIISNGSECNISINKIIGDGSNKSQSGIYTCRLNCSAEEEYFLVSYHLQITKGPSFSYKVKFVTAFLGYDYRINCSVSYPDEREVILMKINGKGNQTLQSKIMKIGNYYQLDYWLTMTTPEDEGEYICKFFPSTRYGYGLDEIRIFLNVIGKPEITIKTTGNLTFGEKIVFDCEISNMENYTESYEIEWLQGDLSGSKQISKGSNLLKNEKYYELSTELHKSQLIIKHLFKRDCSPFVCRITKPPRFFEYIPIKCDGPDTEEKEETLGIVGKNVEISCKIVRNYKNPIWFIEKGNYSFSITLLIDLTHLDKMPSKYEVFKENAFIVLIIIDVTLEDTGIYKCVYPGLKIINHHIEILEEPIFSVNDITVRKNEKAILSCNATNIEKLQLVWFHNQKILTGKEDRHSLMKITNLEEVSLSIVIFPAQSTDQGNYKCSILGSNPSLHKTAKLTVIE